MNLPRETDAKRAPLIQFWDSDIPEAVAELVKSVEQMNQEMSYMLFDDKSAAGFIVDEFGSDVMSLYNQCAIPAMRADLFRYCFLLKYGGFYIDADYRCIKSIAPIVQLDRQGCLYEREKGLTNSIMYFRDANDPLMEHILENTLENIRTRRSNNVWSVTGPAVLQRLYADEAVRPLFEDFYFISREECDEYLETVTNLDYKLEDSHWFVARHKDICIFRDE